MAGLQHRIRPPSASSVTPARIRWNGGRMTGRCLLCHKAFRPNRTFRISPFPGASPTTLAGVGSGPFARVPEMDAVPDRGPGHGALRAREELPRPGTCRYVDGKY